MAQFTTQDIVRTLDAEMTSANNSLMENLPDRFNRYVSNLIQKEIRIGKEIALRNRESGDRMYIHFGQFPLAIYDELKPSFLKELEVLNIYIYRSNNTNTAKIKIVFHF